MATSTNTAIFTKNASKDFTDLNTPHDRVILVEEQKFYVFSGHLSVCSEFFLTMFTSDFKEKNQLEIEIEELSAIDFHDFLRTLIPGGQSVITADNYSSILASARRFMAPGVLSMCEKFAMDNFDNLDKLNLLKTAFEHNWDILNVRVAEFMVPSKTTIVCLNKCKAEYTLTNSSYICQRCYCSMRITQSELPDYNSFLAKNYKSVASLPTEAQAYLLNTMLSKIAVL